MKAITEIQDPVARPERILQFGEGNFLRAFFAWMIDIVNEKTDFNGNVVMVQPIEQGMTEMINTQKGLYTSILRGVKGGETVKEIRLIDSVSRCINPYENFEEYISCAENPDLRFVVSNTTEAGIAWCETDRLEDRPQSSFPGKVTAFLFHRFRTFNGDVTKGLVFIPCELIDKNGERLKEYVLKHAVAWKLGSNFVGWLNEACFFCNSLVDRIVPGYPEGEAAELWEKIGYRDTLLVAAEIFHLWVIETENDYSKELPLAKAGLNVIWTGDMSFYRTRKVRILNGAHTMSVPAAYLHGLDTVEECINDPLLLRLLHQGLFREIIPAMEGDSAGLDEYANEVVERFANPHVRHLLLSITLNSISKFKTRVLPSLIDYIEKKGTIPAVLAFSLSALIAFYEGSMNKNGEMTGIRGSTPYTIKDDQPVLEYFAELYGEVHEPEMRARKLAGAVLSQTSWWGEDLRRYAGLEDAVRTGLESIWLKGIKKSIESICSRPE